jgi:hypothetical protein
VAAHRLSVVTSLITILVGCVSPMPTGKIAFSSDRDGNPEIYIMNANGSGFERLTYGPRYDTNPCGPQMGSTLLSIAGPSAIWMCV